MALILPFVYSDKKNIGKRKITGASIKLKKARKIRKRVRYEDAQPAEIIVNNNKYSKSNFSTLKDENAPIDFIRYASMNYRRKILVTTCTENDSNAYDVYEVPQPPKSVNGLDTLYSKAITDMRKEIPGNSDRGRYISFADLGIKEHFSDEKLTNLQRIVKNYPQSEWPRLFDEAGIMDLVDAIEFLSHFECTVISDSTVAEDSIQDTIKAMSPINTRDLRNLNKFYTTAKDNTDIITRISYANKLVNGKPLELIKKTDKPKQLVKRMDEVESTKKAA